MGFGVRGGLLHLLIFLILREFGLGCAWGAGVLGHDGPVRKEIVTRTVLRLREMGVVSIVNETLQDGLDARILIVEGPSVVIDLAFRVDRFIRLDDTIDIGDEVRGNVGNHFRGRDQIRRRLRSRE